MDLDFCNIENTEENKMRYICAKNTSEALQLFRYLLKSFDR